MRQFVTFLSLVVALTSPALTAQQSATLRVFLARHGQTDGNLKGIAQGWTDTPLNNTGRRQAEALAAGLNGIHLDAIYSSTLTRSRTTAEAVADGRGITVSSLPGLREVWLGKWENIALDDPIMKRRPPPDRRGPEDGESAAQVAARVNEAVNGILKAHVSGTILIVGHAGANGYVMARLLGLARDELRLLGGYAQSNDELYVVERPAGSFPRVFKYIPPGKFNEL